jgi:UDP-glucose 4-epimerase
MKRVLVVGGQGFLGSYVCQELLDNRYFVVSLDDFSKYGYIRRDYENHPNFKLIEGNAKSLDHWKEMPWQNWIRRTDYIVNCAAVIGGIELFHTRPYDILATNERINAAVLDCAIELHKFFNLERIISISSSMVFENTKKFPSLEADVLEIPPPNSSYGFQKLAAEYMTRAAYEQYSLPYTIIRPFNCIGIGEDDFVKGEKSHVLPDLIMKCLQGQNPLKILGSGNQIRCFTHGKDIARGIRLAMESDEALCEDFNISTQRATPILELAEIVWKKINNSKEFIYESETPFKYDIQKRIPDVSKARDLLGFEAKITLEETVDEVIAYIQNRLESNNE